MASTPKQSPTLPEKSLLEWTTKRANLMIGCYRKTDATDPETYFAAVVAVLARWPREVITVVTEPATGIPSKINWLPSIAEITKACEDAYQPIARQIRRELKGLPPPMRKVGEAAELDAQFERLGLSHLRLGSKFFAPDTSNRPFGLDDLPPLPPVQREAPRDGDHLAGEAGRAELGREIE